MTEATFIMVAEDYVKMAMGKLNPMAAFLSGKIKVKGNLGTIMRMQGLFRDYGDNPE